MVINELNGFTSLQKSLTLWLEYATELIGIGGWRRYKLDTLLEMRGCSSCVAKEPPILAFWNPEKKLALCEACARKEGLLW